MYTISINGITIRTYATLAAAVEAICRIHAACVTRPTILINGRTFGSYCSVQR